MADLKNASDVELLAELQARGLVASVWNAMDARSTIDSDDACSDLTEEQLGQVSNLLFERAGDGLVDILGQRGNDYLSERWSELSDEILAEVRSQPTP